MPRTGHIAAQRISEVTVLVGSAANDLPYGMYGDTITFTNMTSSQGNTTRQVTLAVYPQPTVHVSPHADFAYENWLIRLSCTAADPAGNPLTFHWSQTGGTDCRPRGRRHQRDILHRPLPRQRQRLRPHV